MLSYHQQQFSFFSFFPSASPAALAVSLPAPIALKAGIVFALLYRPLSLAQLQTRVERVAPEQWCGIQALFLRDYFFKAGFAFAREGTRFRVVESSTPYRPAAFR